MTITAQTAKSGPYNGNGSTTVFSYTFKVADEADLVVTVLSADGSTETVKTLTTDYTVSGVGNAGGGSITMLVAPATGEKLTITRSVGLDQEVDLQNRGSVNPQTLEDSLDKLTQIAQDQQQQLDRSLKVDLFETADLITLTTNVNAVAAIATEVGTVAGISSDVTAVAGDAADIGTVAGISSEVGTVAGIATEVGTVAGISADVSTVAGDSADIQILAPISADIQALTVGTGGALTGDWTAASLTVTSADINGGTIDGTVIGASTPAAVTGTTITATGDVDVADKITHTGDTDTSIRFPAADTVTVETAGSEVMRVNSSGDVGIATTTPAAKLDVGGTGAIKVPVGTEAQRPPPAKGQFRFNDDVDTFEGYNGVEWGPLGGGGGVLLKRHRVESFTEVSLSASIPADATAPQDNEGLEVLTYDYTPEASDSTIRVVFLASSVVGGNGTMAAIFAAGSSDARATGMVAPNFSASAGAQLSAEAEFASTGTSARKISVRLGQLFGGTATINDASYSGKLLMSMTIEEYAA